MSNQAYPKDKFFKKIFELKKTQKISFKKLCCIFNKKYLSQGGTSLFMNIWEKNLRISL